MKLQLTFIFSLLLFVFACNSNDDMEVIPEPEEEMEEEVDPQYFFAFTSTAPDTEILFDTIENRIYLFESFSEGRIICYDYENYETVATAPSNGFYVEHNIALGKYNGETELYIADGNIIFIRDGNTLELKDSIIITEFTGDTKIASLEFRAPDLFFIGPGNASFSPIKGSMTYSRSTKSYISNAQFGDSQLRIVTYIDDNDPDFINVIGVSYQTSGPRIVHDKFDVSGMIIDNNIDFSPDGGFSHRILKTSNNAPYFISSANGDIYLKDELNLSQTIGGSFNDFIINDSGDRIYGLSRNDKKLKIFEYPSLDLLRNVNLKEEAKAGFFDGPETILVYYNSTSNLNEKEVYISKLKLL